MVLYTILPNSLSTSLGEGLLGALMIKLSADEDELHKSVPAFQPCLDLRIDIPYLWTVFLGPKDGE